MAVILDILVDPSERTKQRKHNDREHSIINHAGNIGGLYSLEIRLLLGSDIELILKRPIGRGSDLEQVSLHRLPIQTYSLYRKLLDTKEWKRI